MSDTPSGKHVLLEAGSTQIVLLVFMGYLGPGLNLISSGPLGQQKRDLEWRFFWVILVQYSGLLPSFPGPWILFRVLWVESWKRVPDRNGPGGSLWVEVSWRWVCDPFQCRRLRVSSLSGVRLAAHPWQALTSLGATRWGVTLCDKSERARGLGAVEHAADGIVSCAWPAIETEASARLLNTPLLEPRLARAGGRARRSQMAA